MNVLFFGFEGNRYKILREGEKWFYNYGFVLSFIRNNYCFSKFDFLKLLLCKFYLCVCCILVNSVYEIIGLLNISKM